MANNTKIEWADATVNAINGCSLASPGCTNCYAMKLAGTRMKHHPTRAGLTQDTKAGPVWTGEVRLHEPALLQPLAWKRPRRIFWNAHGDLFHPNVPDEWIDRVFASCALTPQHIHMILTKRSARMREYVAHALTGFRIRSEMQKIKPQLIIEMTWPLPNVWLGVSVEDQARADERIPDLLATPAAVRFLSCEPLLGPVDLLRFFDPTGACCGGEPEYRCDNCPSDAPWRYSVPSNDGQWAFDPTIDWVIVGGESGPNARPMHPDWARSLRDQCAAAGVPFHFKQWGEWLPTGSSDGYWHGPKRDSRQYPNSEGVSMLADGRRCCHDFSVAEHRRRIAEGKASCTRAIEVDDGALADFHKSLDATSGPINPLGYQWLYRVGKRAAGRLLDGVEHNGMPEVFRG